MRRVLGRVLQVFGYRRVMGSHPGMQVERRPTNLDNYQGLWVAVKDGNVVAVASTSIALVPELQKLGSQGRGAVAQYVAPRTDTIMIGVG